MKRLVGVELSHQKAPLSIREKVTFNSEDMQDALAELKKVLPEVFIIATCNRLAIYGAGDDVTPIVDYFNRFGYLGPYLSVFDGEYTAVKHLFSTASGLESQALGEHEILGQIKKAYEQAKEAKCIGPVMDELIRRAIYTGKKVRKETAIGKFPVSLASVSYEIIRDLNHNDFSKMKVLVIGTGEMANLMLKIIAKKEIGRLYISSRIYNRAETMTHLYGGEAIEMSDLPKIINDVDVIIGATQTQHYVMDKKEFENLKITRNQLLVDLGLPRNFDPTLKTLSNIKLFDLDDIKSITAIGMQKRQGEVPKALEIVDEELKEFMNWLNARQVSPIIASYFDKLERIREEELKWAMPKLGNLDDQQKKIIENLTSRLTRRVSGKPIERLRDFSQKPQAARSPIETFKELFDL